ncbi:MAG: Rieske 2Fe-2S domain-containing protein [Deltaproteobacteria bacterium]|nr:Rieske 2Fe-2S domain-containing protein [Deltaproteobacteria bacterium]
MTRPPFPEGWYRLAAARDVPRGAVVTRRLAGRELVMFRTEQGRLTVSGAHCPHLGAHLGHGGRVLGETLRCPFHGFRYATDGVCVATEYADPTPPRACLEVWPSREVAEQVLVFVGTRDGAPRWALEPPCLDGFTRPRWVTLALAGHVEDAAENGVDLGHFAAVHHYANVRDAEIHVDGPVLHSRFGFDRASPFGAAFGTISSVFDTDIHGLGFSVTDLTVRELDLHCVIVLMCAPIDEGHFDFTILLASDRARPAPVTTLGRVLALAPARAVFERFLLRRIVGDVLQDREIWAHKTHVERPLLAAGDGPIGLFRNWTKQFYGQ